MFIPEKLKLNKFRLCSIPSNREYFTRFGFASPAESSFTGDIPAPQPMNKTESAEDYLRYAAEQAEIDRSKSSVESKES